MDDAKRFVRYLVPGAIFGLQTAAILWILRPDWIEEKLPYLASESGVGLALAGLLGSGALGFVFSVIHHEIHWWSLCSTINHTIAIHGLISTGRLRVVAIDSNGNEENVGVDQINRELAWTIFSSLWHSRLSEDPMKSAEPRAASLSDTAHSLGTARAAVFGALVAALLVAARVSGWHPYGWPLTRFIIAVLFGVGVVVFFWRTYLRTARLAQMFIEQVIWIDMAKDEKPSIVHIQSSFLPKTGV